MNDGRIVIFLICIVIATLFWFLNALNKEYTVDLIFPVRYTNLPQNKVLANNPPDQFVLKVNSYGFTILRHKLSMAFSPLIFNVNEFTGGRMETSPNSKFSIATRQFIKRFSGQVSNELEIVEIQPDTLYFEFDRIVQKKVKVKTAITYTLKRQFYPSGEITTEPDSVLVSGPESIMDTLACIRTKFQTYKDLDKDIQRNVQLEQYDKLILDTKRVVLKIPMEEFTQKQLMVPIHVTGVPDNVSVKLFPDKVKVNFMVGLSHFNEITDKEFELAVTYSDIENKKQMLDVTVRSQPQHVLSVSINPARVEYLIEKKTDD